MKLSQKIDPDVIDALEFLDAKRDPDQPIYRTLISYILNRREKALGKEPTVGFDTTATMEFWAKSKGYKFDFERIDAAGRKLKAYII